MQTIAAYGVLITLALLLTACGGGGDSTSAPPPPAATTPTPSPVDPGVGATAETCGRLTLSASNPFKCCGTDPEKSGNCTASAWQVFFNTYTVALPLGSGVSEAELPAHLKEYKGSARWPQRITDPDKPLPERTTSAFAWSYLARTSGDSRFSVSDKPSIDAVAVSWTLGADGHVAVVRGAWMDGSVLKLLVEDSACITSETGRPHETRSIEASHFQEYIVYLPAQEKPVVAFAGAAPPAEVPVGQSFSVALNVTDKNGDLATLRRDYGDGTSSTLTTTTGADILSYPFTHVYAKAGTYTWTATATDRLGKTGTLSGSVVITATSAPPPPAPPAANTAPRISVTGGGSTSATPGTAWDVTTKSTDDEGNLKSVSIAWSDGKSGKTNSADGSTETETFSRTFEAADGGKSFSWTITVADTAGATGTVSGSVNVAAPNNGPKIESLSNTKPKATGVAQLIAIAGTGFTVNTLVEYKAPGGSYTKCCLSGDPIFVSDTLIGTYPAFVATGTWSVRVSEGGKSDSMSFTVEPK